MTQRILTRWGLGLAPLVLAACASAPTERYSVLVERLVEGVPLHGIQGLTWGLDDQLYAAAMSSQKVSRIDPATGRVEVLADAPFGESDDVAIGPDGTIVWTAMAEGELRARRADGSMDVIARDLRGLNPVAFSPDGRLFAVVMGQQSRLMEFDVQGRREPRLVSDKIKLLNSFDFGSDGFLYGPFWRSGELVKMNVDTGEQTLLVSGVGEPAAVELDSNGQIITVDYHTGDVRRTDPDTGVSRVLVTLDPPLDNLAIGPDDTIYVSDTARSGIYVLSPDGTLQGRLLGGEFSTPGGLATVQRNGSEALVVADSTGYRFVDPKTGNVDRPHFKSSHGTSLALATYGTTMALSDPRMGRVHVIDLETGEPVFDKFGFDVPYGIAVLPSKEIVIAEYGNGTVSIWDGESVDVIATGLSGPVAVVVESNDSLLVTEHTSGNLVRIDQASGAKTVLFSGLNRPEGLAVMADGRIAIADVGAARLVAVDLAAAELEVLATGLEFGIAAVRAPQVVGVPNGVAVGQDGAIYLNEDGANAVTKVRFQ